jgi:hypothetical protein
MGFTVVAVLVGVLVGFVTGGRVGNVNKRSLQLVWLLAVSVALQVVAEVLDVGDEVGLALVLVSYVGLSGFALANSRLVGMPVVLVGLLCNLAVITVNGGMPVERDALLASRAASAAEVDGLDFGAKRHLAHDADTMRFLDDRVPVRPSREVLSIGDLILAFGIADVIFRLLKPVELRRREHRDDDAEAEATVDLTGTQLPTRSRDLVHA